jgi:hypothetical protein
MSVQSWLDWDLLGVGRLQKMSSAFSEWRLIRWFNLTDVFMNSDFFLSIMTFGAFALGADTNNCTFSQPFNQSTSF